MKHQNSHINRSLVALPLDPVKSDARLKNITFHTNAGEKIIFKSVTPEERGAVEEFRKKLEEKENEIAVLRSENRELTVKDLRNEEILEEIIAERYQEQLDKLNEELMTMQQQSSKADEKMLAVIKDLEIEHKKIEMNGKKAVNIAQQTIIELEDSVADLQADNARLQNSAKAIEDARLEREKHSEKEIQTLNNSLAWYRYEIEALNQDIKEAAFNFDIVIRQRDDERERANGLFYDLEMSLENTKKSRFQFEKLQEEIEKQQDFMIIYMQSYANTDLEREKLKRENQGLDNLCRQLREGNAELWSKYYILLQENTALGDKLKEAHEECARNGMDGATEMQDTTDAEPEHTESNIGDTDYEDALVGEYARVQKLHRSKEANSNTQIVLWLESEDAMDKKDGIDLSDYEDFLGSEIQQVRGRRFYKNENGQHVYQDKSDESTGNEHRNNAAVEMWLANQTMNSIPASVSVLSDLEGIGSETSEATVTRVPSGGTRQNTPSEIGEVIDEAEDVYSVNRTRSSEMAHRDSTLQFVPSKSAPVQERYRPIEMKIAARAAARAEPPVKTEEDFHYFKENRQCVWCGSAAHQVKSMCDVYRVLKEENRCEACRSHWPHGKKQHERTCELRHILELMNYWKLRKASKFIKALKERKASPRSTLHSSEETVKAVGPQKIAS